MAITDILSQGWPMLVIIFYDEPPEPGERLRLEDLAKHEGEATTTFDFTPDHYARGISSYAWPIWTVINEITNSRRYRRLMEVLEAKPPYYCTILKGILAMDRNMKPVSCLVPVNWHYNPERRLAVIVPTVEGDYIVFTAWRNAADILYGMGCENIAYGVFICRRDPGPELRKLRIPVFYSHEAVKMDEYLREVVGYAPALH